jgi:glycosyltransferase involved in cell wall biosynthesis
MKRLLFITEHFPPALGGVAVSANRIVTVLCGLGVEVDVIAWTRALQPGVVDSTGENPRVFRAGRYREWDNTFPHTMNLCDWLYSVAPYDWIWGHYLAPAGFFAAWLGRLKGTSSIVSIRGNDLDREMFPPGDFARLLWTLEHATIVTAVTEELSRKVTALAGREDVVHLPNSVDHEVFRPEPVPAGLREQLGIQPDEFVLGFCGELREKKGLHAILDALRQVRAKRPACLLIIGEVRPSQMPKLFEYTGTEPLAAHRILVTGALAGGPRAVNQHLQLCDVYLQPSLWDGMPNALLEAMAAGCGCIASDAGGIPEIITPGVDGVIVPRWQLHHLSEAVFEWVNASEAHRRGMREAARVRVVEHFNFDQERLRLRSLLSMHGSLTGRPVGE